MEQEETEKQWKAVYKLGGAAALAVVVGSLLDIVIGTSLGGDVSAIPKTAVERFAQFRANWLLGLYYLDVLNITTNLILLFAMYAIYTAQRRTCKAGSGLALALFILGSAIFTTNNTALPMLELSQKYTAAATDAQKALIAAAGEAMLARGAHGSPGAFPGFIIVTAAVILMSFAMWKGGVFGKATAGLGIAGSILMALYILLVTFVPALQSVAMAIAAPGGLMSIAWMIMFANRLFRLARSRRP